MKQKDKTLVRWNRFINRKYQCFDCGFECKYKANYTNHIKQCSKDYTFYKKAEAVRRFL